MALDFIDPQLLPFLGSFLFVFAVVFGLLTYSKLLGFSRNVNALIAIVFGLFAASFEPFSTGLFNILPVATIPLVILFFFVFIQKIFQPEGKKDFDAFPPVLLLGISLLLLAALWDRIGISIPGISTENAAWLIGLTFVLILFMAVYYHKPPKETPG